MDVAGFWLPGLVGCVSAAASGLGLSVLRHRCTWAAVPFAMLSAVLLAWEAQVGQVVIELATWQDLVPPAARSRPQELQEAQQHIFGDARELFGQLLHEHGCTVSSGGSAIKCSALTVEAGFVPQAVQELCRARSGSDSEFQRRVHACLDQGQKLQLLPGALSDADMAYCRCWSGTFDIMQVIARWVHPGWLAELLSALCVLYVAAGAKLARMNACEHFELLGFGLGSAAFLACKAIIFAEVPWAKHVD